MKKLVILCAAAVATVAWAGSVPTTGVPASLYVQDGLVAHYDAIENAGAKLHDDAPTEWINLADGADDAVLPTGAFSVNPKSIILTKGRAVVANLSCARADGTLTMEGHVKLNDLGTAQNTVPFVTADTRGSLGYDTRSNNGFFTIQPSNNVWGAQISLFKWWGKFNLADRAYVYHTVSGMIPVSPIRDGGSGKVFMDATSQAYYSQWNSGKASSAPDGKLYIGNAACTYEVGAIRVYNRELTAAEVTYNAVLDRTRFQGTDPEAEGWRFQDGKAYAHVVVEGTPGLVLFTPTGGTPSAKIDTWIERGETLSFTAQVAKGFVLTWTGDAPTWNDDTKAYELVVDLPKTSTAVAKSGAVEIIDLTAAARKKNAYRALSASTSEDKYPVGACFDGSTSGNSASVWHSQTVAQGADLSNQWVQHQFTDTFEPGKSIVVVTYRIYGINNGDSLNNRPRTWELLGSNTGADDSWTVLDTRTCEWTKGTEDFQCQVLQPFRYYRLHMTSVKNATQYKLNEVAFYGVVTDGADPFDGYRLWVGAATGDWHESANWTGGKVPAAGDKVQILAGNTVVMSNSSARIGALYLKGTLRTHGWETAVNADTVEVQNEGVITCDPCTEPGADTNRLHIVCDDLVINQGGSVTAAAKGYAVKKGPGASTLHQRAGASSAGFGGGAYRSSNYVRVIYGDTEYPESPGSGGWTSPSLGGGVLRTDASRCVTVNGTLTAAGGDASDYKLYNTAGSYVGAGSGGSLLVNCADFAGTGGTVSAAGGGGRIVLSGSGSYASGQVSGPGGGGRIAIHKSSSRPANISGVTFTSAPGEMHGGTWTGAITYFDSKVTTEDKYFCDGGLGTLWFSDKSFLTALKGDGALYGRLYGVPLTNTFDSIAFKKGHVAFAKAGSVVNVTGDLTVDSADARFVLGGDIVSNRTYRTDYYNGTVPLELNVGGNLVLSNGGRLDVQSAATNVADAAVGATVTVAGDITVTSNSSIYAYSDVETGCSPAFFAANVEVAEGALISADCRGFGGGWSVANTTLMRKNGYGPGASRPNSSGTEQPVPGGGHGGIGGQTNLVNQGGTTYDDPYRPQLAGSGGGCLRKWELMGGNGGGVISLTATNSIVVDGRLSADGETCQGNPTSCGAGGTIYLSAPTVCGSTAGVLSAKGGSTASTSKNTGAGGGGRIGVWTGRGWYAGVRRSQLKVRDVEPVESWVGGEIFEGTCTVDGGTSGYTDDAKVFGQPGTVWFTDVRKYPDGFLLLVR